MKSTEEIKREFDNLVQEFEKIKAPVMENDRLVEMTAKHPLYEIEPFFSEHNNEYIDESASLLIHSEDDFDPEKDKKQKVNN